MGALSYGVYLLHMLVGGIVVKLLRTHVSSEAGLQQVGFVIAGVLATIGVSAILHLAVERPSIVLSKRLTSSAARVRFSLGWSILRGSPRLAP
jgi:peptidoglycan/LPS O-acetylase OafA/YrhL